MDYLFRRSYCGPVKAVILDWAGTTMDYGCCAPAAVFVDVFRRKGVEITTAEARGPMGANKRTHIAEIAAVPRVAEAWRTAHGSACAEDDMDAMYADFIPLQVACLPDYAELIPGTLEAVKHFRSRGMKIGSTTGYSREMMEVLIPEGIKRGYEPDSALTATEVPAGRPAPWMALASAMEMNVYPPEAIVKIGDTVPDIGEGLNAGMWTIGVARTGNELGLNEAEAAALDSATLDAKLERAYRTLAAAGAHYVVDGIGDVPPLIDAIEARIRSGEKP